MSGDKSQSPRIGLALSGGAARGIAHVGVIRALLENQIPIDCVAGTSAGSLVGGSFASGMPVENIEKIARSMRWRDVGRMTMSRMGVQSNERMEDYLRRHLPVTRFEDFPIPFAAVATDLNSGEAVVMRDEGDVAFAIRASCAIPGWYVPVLDEYGRQLVDGGLVANNPVSVTRALGADIVVAVDVNAEGATFLGPSLSIISIVLQSMMHVQRTVSSHELKNADVVIQPRVGHVRWDEMRRAEELLSAGYESGLASVAEIKRVIEEKTPEAPRWYRLRKRRLTPGQRLPST
jgi:NTE family protein